MTVCNKLNFEDFIIKAGFHRLWPIYMSKNCWLTRVFTAGTQSKFKSINLQIFSYQSVLSYVLGAQKNGLIETVLLSTHNIWFG